MPKWDDVVDSIFDVVFHYKTFADIFDLLLAFVFSAYLEGVSFDKEIRNLGGIYVIFDRHL